MRPGARLKALQPAWLITAVAATLSTVLFLTVLRDLDSHLVGQEIPWWLIAVGVAIAESLVVHLHFRSESGSFSFFEIPLAVGLLYTRPGGVWLATLVGLPVALIIVRRQAPIKVLFNVANFTLHAAVAVVIFGAFHVSDPLAPGSWLILTFAITMGALVQVVPLVAVITATEGTIRRKQVVTLIVTAIAVSLVNTTQALIAVLLVANEPWSVVPLFVTTMFVYLAYRSYLSERASRERVEFLYSSTKAFRESADAEVPIGSLLSETAEMFRAFSTHLFLLPRDETGLAVMLRYLSSDRSQERVEVEQESVKALCEAGERPSHHLAGEVPPDLQAFFEAEDLHDAMIGSLHGSDGTIGVLVVGDRLGSVTAFTRNDLQLFETLVEQAAVMLANVELETTISKMQHLEQSLRHRAGHDGLTGLANRTTFDEGLAKSLASGELGAVLYLDLDDFKIVNDRLGHDAGDAVLVEISSRIDGHMSEGDLAARMGGDEFAIIINETRDSVEVARDLIRALHEPILIGGDAIQVGASIGVSRFDGSVSSAEVLRFADTAMYQAKRNGKGSVVEYDHVMASNQTDVSTIRTQLKLAIDQEDFQLLYQPIVDASSGRIVGAEALVRWLSEGELLTPAAFLDEAESSGLIVAIDRSVLTMAIDQLDQLVERFDIFVSVNLSTKNFEVGGLTMDVRRMLDQRGVQPESLVIEIATAALNQFEHLKEEVRELRESGVRVALEDFGSLDYSLARLSELSFDIVKIKLAQSAQTSAHLFDRGIAAFAQAAGKTVLACEIEETFQFDEATSARFDLLQGFLLGHPIPADELLRKLEVQDQVSKAS
jgi:diguanylate cyclase (GGDEF)-like protein